MSGSLKGSFWVRKNVPHTEAKIVDESWSIGGRPGRILTVVYGPDFKPSILPSTVFMTDFMSDYEPSLRGEV
jgi:hypothetical protein